LGRSDEAFKYYQKAMGLKAGSRSVD